MLRKVVVVALSIVCITARAQPPSRYPVAVKNYFSPADLIPGHNRVKLSLAGEEGYGNVLLAGLMVCSRSICYKPETAQSLLLQDTARGRASVAGDFVMPRDTIEGIYFDQSKSSGAIGGAITLPVPLKLEKDVHGTEIFLVLKKSVERARIEYRPSFVATNFFAEHSTSVYYLPSRPITADLPLKVVLRIPAGALQAPAVFSVAVHDTGRNFPMVDIYPYVALSKAAILERAAITRPAASMTGMPAVPAPAPVRSGVSVPADAKTQTSSSKSFLKTGVFAGS